MKTCNSCQETKPLSEFHIRRAARDGRQGKCKPCAIEYWKAYRLGHLDEIRERSRRYVAKKRQEARAVR